MKKLLNTAVLLFTFMIITHPAFSAVVPNFANNNYQNHELSRAEQKCIDEGYKTTYANCANQTAPADRCPYHDAYYRSCSQEQWCRNNNYTFLAAECHKPLYPTKICSNRFPLYRACQENPAQACENEGYVSASKCQLSNKLCPYSKNYGRCCDQCPEYSHFANQIPEGYIAAGETCTTCEGVVKTNLIPAICEGYQTCPFGPLSTRTPRCRQGDQNLYTACKTAEVLCREQGFSDSSCEKYEDAIDCPHAAKLKKCQTNCLKLAQSQNLRADIINEDVSNPRLDLTKTELQSLADMNHPECPQIKRPTIELTISDKNLPLYKNIFDRKIENVNLKINFEAPVSLTANGSLHNVKITISGNIPPCPFKSTLTTISGNVSFEEVPELCLNLNIKPDSKLLTDGSIKGNVTLGKDSALGIKGNLIGGLRTGAYSDVYIKGRLEYNDPLNTMLDMASIQFGCNSKNNIVEGIIADTSSIYIRQYAKIDTPSITLRSISNNLDLPNTLASINVYKYANVFSTYGNEGEETIFPIIENTKYDCDDKYYIHLGSAADIKTQKLTIEPSNRIQKQWKCRSLSRKQMACD